MFKYLLLFLLCFQANATQLYQVNSKLYKKIQSYHESNNIFYLIKTTLKSYHPLYQFIDKKFQFKNSSEFQSYIYKNLNLDKPFKKSNNSIRPIIHKWLSKNPQIEDYYGINDLQNCLYTKDNKPIVNLNKFINLQEDFLTYFAYSINTGILTKDDITTELFNFSRLFNILNSNCDFNFAEKTKVINLYVHFLKDIYKPLLKNKKINFENASKVFLSLDTRNTSSYIIPIQFIYALMINSIKSHSKDLKTKRNLIYITNDITNDLITLNKNNFATESTGLVLNKVSKLKKTNEILFNFLSNLEPQKYNQAIQNFQNEAFEIRNYLISNLKKEKKLNLLKKVIQHK